MGWLSIATQLLAYLIDTDDSGLNKCRNKSDPLYVELHRQVKRLIPNATPKLNESQLFVKEKLPCVPGAAFDDAENGADACLAGTRIELLGDIREWLRDPEREPLCWLHGKAGTGKSTIAQSVARERAAAGLLAASFFFKRGEGDRGNARLFFPAIAAQLVSSFPAAAAQMRHTIEANPDIASKPLGEQFRLLVLKPLENVAVASPMTVVIDALDECDGENDTKDIITQLSHIKKITSIPLNFFITSRNEPPIREGFKSIQSIVDELKLEEVSEPSVEQDIERFLLVRLEAIRSLAQLPPGWPQGEDFNRLLKMSVPLFIYAATACRFIEDKRIPGGPQGRLRRWTEHIGGSRLHFTYRPILKQLIDGLDEPEKEAIINRFHEIVGTIIVLAEPLDTTSLECLLSKPPNHFDDLLDYLHSALDIPLSRVKRIKLFHLSFRDYLVDSKRGALEFHVDEKEAQRRVASDCLRLLSDGQSLRQDICSLSHPGTKRKQVPQTKIDECLPPAVQYACLHWADHFIYSEDLINDQDAVYSFLCTHLLHWLEALSLLNRLDIGVSQIHKLQERTTCLQVKSFVTDAGQFIGYFRSPIIETPLQLYASCLTFAPLSSIVRNTFQAQRPKWISEVRLINTSWNRQLRSFDDGIVGSATFTADNHLAIGAFDGTITVMDPDTCQCLQVLEGHQATVLQCALAPNGNLITCSSDTTIKVWDLPSGTCLKTLLGHDVVRSIAIAANDLVASRSDDNTVKVWDTTTEECLWTSPFIDHHGIAFASDNGKIRLAIFDSENHIRVFDPATKSCLQTLNVGHQVEAMALVLTSRHELLLVATDRPKALVIYNLNTGTRVSKKGQWNIAIRPTTLSDGNPCQQVVLVPIRSRHATLEILTSLGSADTDISVNDLENLTNGAMKLVDAIPSFIGVSSCCALSNDGRWLSSASLQNRSVFVFDLLLDHETRDTQRAAALELGYEANNDKHEPTISLCISADATLVAELSSHLTIRILDHDTRSIQQTLYCQEQGYQMSNLMVFSPNKLLLARATSKPKLTIWDLPTAKCIASFEIPGNNLVQISCLRFSNDNEIMALTHWGAPPVILKWQEGKRILHFEFQSHAPESIRYYIRNLAFSKDNNFLITADIRGDITIWDISKMTFLRIIERDDNVLSTAGLSSQKEFINITTRYGMIKIDIASLRSIMGQRSLRYSDGWIVKDDVAFLWIPSEYRPRDSEEVVAIDSLKGLIYISTQSGRVWSLQVSLPELDQLVLKYPYQPYSRRNRLRFDTTEAGSS